MRSRRTQWTAPALAVAGVLFLVGGLSGPAQGAGALDAGALQPQVDLLEAAQTGDQSAVELPSANWYANADAIGAFVSAANPEAWPLVEMQSGMRMHLDLTLDEATTRLKGDFESDIAAYDEVDDHILAFADLLSDGIIAQFPDRFTS